MSSPEAASTSTAEEARRNRIFVRILVVQMLCIVLLIVSVWITSYQGRSELVHSQRLGCERGKQDREANAKGWRNAEKARRASGDTAVAEEYAAIAAGLEFRSQIDCAKAYPDPRLIQLR